MTDNPQTIDAMLSAQKARNIQMLQVGELNKPFSNILDASLKGEDHVYVTDAEIGYNLATLQAQGFDFEYVKKLEEWKISWAI